MTALSTTLARSLASGVLLLDEEGGVVALNEVGARLLGIEAPEPGTPLADALAPVPELVDRLAEAVAGRSGMRREEVTVEGRAGRLTLGITVHPLRRDDGRVRGHLTLFTDLTETRRQEIEEKLAESLADLGELAAGVAHELRNGMATLRGYLTLMDRAPGEESMADYLGEVRREADSLQRVLEDFLTFARPGSARLEEVDLTTVVRRAAADPALAGAPVRVVVAGDGPALLRGDAELLGRAVRNLLANAVEASRHAGGAPVEVLLERRGDDWRLAVDDRGAGLPPAVRARLFQPFVAGRPGGVGLGLALAHRIVSLHGGRLRMEDRPGGGTRAVALLPVGGSVTIGNDSSVPVAPGSPGGKLPSSAGSTG
jgi:signal transduction histidine kinase